MTDGERSTVLAVYFVLACVLLSYCNYADAKEPAWEVSIGELSDYDGKLVSVRGWIKEVAQKKGRLGSNYLVIRVGSGSSEVKVCWIHRIYGIDHEAVIIGTYYEDGWCGGHLADHFIRAVAVVRNWELMDVE